jgi:glycosyltransferase involved in cell wall biosynthesis
VCAAIVARALHVLGSLRPGGVERWLRDTVRFRASCSRWRFDFCLLGSERGSYAAQLEALGCRVLHCPLAPRATFAVRLFRLLRCSGYQVVHSHVHHFSGIVLAVAHAAGVPVRAAHSHTCEEATGSPGRRLYRRAMRALLENSMTRGFACSRRAAGSAGERLCPRFRILPCGIDLRAFQQDRPGPPRLRRELGIPHNASVVGHVGRLAPEKNQAFLLRVMARLISRSPRAHLVIAGGGILREELQATARRLGLQRRVIFAGPRDDVPELFASVFDALALPSLREGLPAVVLEAQAAGLHCVVSEHTPHEAMAVPALVEPISLAAGTGAWADALARALHQPRLDPRDTCSRLERLGFDVAASFGALTEAYEQGLSQAQPELAADPASRDTPLRAGRG